MPHNGEFQERRIAIELVQILIDFSMFSIPHRRKFARPSAAHPILPAGNVEEPELPRRAPATMHPKQNHLALGVDKRPWRRAYRLTIGEQDGTHFRSHLEPRGPEGNVICVRKFWAVLLERILATPNR